MAPIPIHTKSPINAAKASGAMPKTADPTPSALEVQPSAQVSAGPTHDGYPAAKPGAVPFLPEPTSSVLRYQNTSLQPTPTTKSESEADRLPPPPQPGAAPTPSLASKVSLPPPPKAGEKYRGPQATQVPEAREFAYPSQLSMPAPMVSHAQRGTSTATVPLGMSPSRCGPLGGIVGYSTTSKHDNPAVSGYQPDMTSELEEGDNQGVWSSAMKWAQAAGSKLSEAESQVWRKINKE
jgi:hypothetical protein